ETDLIFHKGRRLPFHSNAMRFKAFDQDGKELYKQIFYSVGGGFVVDHEQIFAPSVGEKQSEVPFPFKTAEELLAHCRIQGKSIDEIMLENEQTWRSTYEIRDGILEIWNVMQASVKRGCSTEGILPGGLQVKRRASQLYQKLQERGHLLSHDPSYVFDWIS